MSHCNEHLASNIIIFYEGRSEFVLGGMSIPIVVESQQTRLGYMCRLLSDLTDWDRLFIDNQPSAFGYQFYPTYAPFPFVARLRAAFLKPVYTIFFNISQKGIRDTIPSSSSLCGILCLLYLNYCCSGHLHSLVSSVHGCFVSMSDPLRWNHD